MENKTLKVIIAGSRTFSNFKDLVKYCNKILYKKYKEGYIIEIVSGGARGADKLGEDYAKLNNFKYTVFEANWDMYDKKAGYLRNEEMASYSDALIAFWDGKSKGTKHMISLAREYDMPVRIIRFDRLISKI